jgi:hypothetical protein
MAMLSANSTLVAGSVAAEANMMQKIQVVRPFWNGGKARQAGTVLEVADNVAAELIAMGKAAPYVAPTPKPAPPKVEPPKESK